MNANVPATTTSAPGAVPARAPANAANSEAVNAAQKALRTLSPPQRAAAVLSLLGPDYAGQIVEKIDDQHMVTFMETLERIKMIPRDVTFAIVADFLTQLKQQNGAVRGGLKESRLLTEQLLSGDRKERVLGAEPLPVEMNFAFSDDEDDVWTKVQDANPKKLAEYLKTQRPQLVAIVMGQLSPDAVGVILIDLPDNLSQYVVRALANPQEIDEQTLQIVGQVVEQEFLSRAEEEEEGSDPLTTVSSVLSVLPSDKREKLMEYLYEKDAAQAEKIRKGLVTFEDIPEQLPRNAVPIIFRELEEAELIKALKYGEDVAPGSVEYLYSNISQRMAQQYKEQVEELTVLSKKDGEAAQSAMMTLIATLDRNGTIKLIKVTNAEDEA